MPAPHSTGSTDHARAAAKATEKRDLQQRRERPAERLTEHHRVTSRQGLPEAHVQACPERPGAEAQQRDQRARIAAAGAEQRARAATTAELHADAEQECANGHLQAERRPGPVEFKAQPVGIGE